MSNFWKEIEKLSQKAENETDRELAKSYKEALEELKDKLSTFIAEHQDLKYVDLMQLTKLEALYAQIDNTSKNALDEVRDEVYKTVLKEIELGYFGEFYNIESQLQSMDIGVDLSFGLLSEDYVRKIIEFPVNGIPLSKRLYGDTLPAMQKAIKSTLTEGLIQGYNYREIARNLSDTMDSSYNRAKVIIRTEAGRVRSMSRQEAQDKAAALGVHIQKKWIATLDKKTRYSHASLDGQVVDKDEEFTSPRGYKAMQPRMFGVPSEDINCRCGCTSVVDGIDQKLRKDNIDKSLGEFGTYEEWLKNKYGEDLKEYKKTSDKIITESK